MSLASMCVSVPERERERERARARARARARERVCICVRLDTPWCRKLSAVKHIFFQDTHCNTLQQVIILHNNHIPL